MPAKELSPARISSHPVHLGRGGTATAQPAFTGDMAWFDAYTTRHAEDGLEGRLVSMFSFSEDWDSWEVHPNGHEIVLCTAGTITLHQEAPDGTRSTVTLTPGEYVINEPGVWHTADVKDHATAVFITAGLGTEHRPR